MSSDNLFFFKACSLGNDFVILSLPKERDLSALSIFLADRRYGVGCDQVIFFQESLFEKTYTVRFFNADGSEAEGCGNGSRCVAKLLMDERRWTTITLETIGGTLICQKTDENSVFMQMPLPKWENSDMMAKATYVTVGNPHLVCFVDDIDDIEIKGPILETYLYQTDKKYPKRVNVGFVQIMDRKNIALKVWERGVGLTPACGTGACAAVVASCVHNLTTRKVTVHQSGGLLEVDWSEDVLSMKGEARIIYQGEISIVGLHDFK